MLIVSGIQPNFIVILTDDQDTVLGGLSPMNKTKSLIAEQGVTFENAYATTPLCCPSRSSILTGGCSGRIWKERFECRTFGALLHAAGYRTFYAGKYMNQYGHKNAGGTRHIPEGWDWWVGLVGNSAYYNYTLSVNGTEDIRGDNEQDYLTDLLWLYSEEFLRSTEEPFLMVISTPAPHEPFTPARRHKGAFSKLKAPRTPNFNKSPGASKHWLVRQPPNVLTSDIIKEIDKAFRDRWETLLSVDEMVDGIIRLLKQLDALDNTYIIFTSDNGFHLGQFALPWDKRQPYETDIKIPLMMMGPEIPRNKVVSQPVLNIDIAPTILDIARVRPAHPMDGKSFFSAVNSAPKAITARSFLVEYFGEGEESKCGDCTRDPDVKLCSKKLACKCLDSRNNTYSCIRQLGMERNEIYCWFHDNEQFRELYNLQEDPHQMDNIAMGSWEWRTKLYDDLLTCCKSKAALGENVEKCFKE
ncbi:UNVERIFIED_CONTAM: hypothetical protein PYX00_007088 [Menopon gallinae]|uniref:Sulfatase N-terminal domain-containing protein n=1 Tax=Menopon gallinae TaxID=328185 RepID=A0AAW2HIE4_9NEOP